MDAAILFADILVVPHALGQRVQFREGEGPLLGPLPSIADLAARKENGIHKRLAPVYDTVRLVRAALAEETALIGFAGAPWTVATYMVEGGTSRDFRAVKTWALARRQEFEALIDLLSDVTAEYLLQQVAAGAEAVQVFDTWAGCLAEPEIRRWVMAPTARIVERIKASHPGVPVIGFPRGIGVLYGEYVRETGVDAVGLDPSVPVEWAAQTLQSFCTVQGNLDPQLLVVGGAPMEAEAKRILNALGGGPFVFNLGHGIVPETPPQHVADLARVIRSWRRQ
jgi:uroporphyrinogen decarboxylase